MSPGPCAPLFRGNWVNRPAKPTDMQNNRAKRHYFMGEWASLDRAADLWRAWLFGEGVGLWTPRAGICGTPRSSDRGRQSTYQTVFITLANTWLSTQVEDFEVWHERWPLLEKWSPEEDGRDPGYISYNSQSFKKKTKASILKKRLFIFRYVNENMDGFIVTSEAGYSCQIHQNILHEEWIYHVNVLLAFMCVDLIHSLPSMYLRLH